MVVRKKERGDTVEALIVMLAVLALILLAVLALKYGADSRPTYLDTQHNWW